MFKGEIYIIAEAKKVGKSRRHLPVVEPITLLRILNQLGGFIIFEFRLSGCFWSGGIGIVRYRYVWLPLSS